MCYLRRCKILRRWLALFLRRRLHLLPCFHVSLRNKHATQVCEFRPILDTQHRMIHTEGGRQRATCGRAHLSQLSLCNVGFESLKRIDRGDGELVHLFL